MYAAFALGAPVGSALYAGYGFVAIAVATAVMPALTLLAVLPLRPVAPTLRGAPSIGKVLGAVWAPGIGLALSSLGFGAMMAFITLLFADRGWSPTWPGLEARSNGPDLLTYPRSTSGLCGLIERQQLGTRGRHLVGANPAFREHLSCGRCGLQMAEQGARYDEGHREDGDRERIMTESERVGSALRIHELLQQSPFATAGQLVERTGLTTPTVNAALADLERLGIVDEVTGRRRGRVFSYRGYLAILNEGTAPLPITA